MNLTEVIFIKISEFALENNVTTKMLRHYDNIGLLKPFETDNCSGYRIYSQEQSKYVYWINILKHLDFSLKEIKMFLDNYQKDYDLLLSLKQKRLEINNDLDIQITKKIQIDKLIFLIEKDGFNMDKNINLMDIETDKVIELLKNIPNNGHFLESVNSIISKENIKQDAVIICFDIFHFKSVNDDYGHEVGDKVITAIYQIFKETLENEDYIEQFAIGRHSGDEFLIMFLGTEENGVDFSKAVIQNFNSYDFSKIGCDRNMGGYFGVLVVDKNNPNIRVAIHNSDNAQMEAKKQGKNGIYVQRFLG